MKKINSDLSRTLYIGGVYEVNKSPGGTVTRTVTYYPVGGAMRIDGTLYFVLKDHLGSASVVTDSTGNVVGENRYYPYGETRLTTGTMYTDKLYTGQREMTGLGIYHYGARFYSPRLGRFLSADTIVPNPLDPRDLNRFSYVRNNPLRYVDPSGHDPMCGFSYSDPECVSPDPWVPPSTPNNNGSGSNSGSSNNNGGSSNNNNNDDGGSCPGLCLPSASEPSTPDISDDTIQDCPSSTYCFDATQAEVLYQGNTQFWWGVGMGIASFAFVGLGSALLVAALTPSLTVPGVIIGGAFILVGTELFIDALDSGSAASYLWSVGNSMDADDVVQFNVQSDVYYAEGTSATYEPTMPITTLLMEIWAQGH